VAPTGSRGVALDGLREWRSGTLFADAILSRRLLSSGLSTSDRAFATELFYGVLRNRTLLDFWVDSLRSGRVDHDSRDLLRLGLYQLFLLQTPEHAAVFETVALAPRKGRPLINGVLRNAARRRTELLTLAREKDLSVRESHPPFLVDRWIKHFGSQQTDTLCQWNNQPASVYARINRLRISTDDFTVRHPDFERLPDRENFVRLTTLPGEAIATGECYIQDPSTAAACLLLDPQPGERVLDACAAPGGKTGYVAELMTNQGLIVSCDRDQHRLRVLQENLERLGVANNRSVEHDWTNGGPFPNSELFDRILVDAPCSNTGVMRRRVDVRWRLTPDDFSRMAAEQFRIVAAVVPLLKPGGVLVYSTCSLEPEENRQLVNRLLGAFPILKMSDEISVLPFRDGFDGAYAAKLLRVL
jgi:16S rRNA (cytosine967-C5)-methyltransferase